MTQKITVNQDLCIGCGACAATCPNTFELSDSGKAQTISEEGLCLDDECSICIDVCPVGAISEKEN